MRHHQIAIPRVRDIFNSNNSRLFTYVTSFDLFNHAADRDIGVRYPAGFGVSLLMSKYVLQREHCNNCTSSSNRWSLGFTDAVTRIGTLWVSKRTSL